MGWFVAFPPSRNRGARMGHPAPFADEDLFVGAPIHGKPGSEAAPSADIAHPGDHCKGLGARNSEMGRDFHGYRRQKGEYNQRREAVAVLLGLVCVG
jgi:hypothetical protein